MINPVAIVALSARGAELGVKIQPIIANSELHGFQSRITTADVLFSDPINHFRDLYSQGISIIGICSSGILIRAIAPLIKEKLTEPPVLALTEDGSVIVPLLGGHRGANRLAQKVSSYLNCYLALTTAGDARFNLALDDPPIGYVLENPENSKAVMAALLNNEPVKIEGDAPWLEGSDIQIESSASRRITVSPIQSSSAGLEGLTYRPKVLAVGVGCERNADSAELIKLVEKTLQFADLAPGAIAGFFSHVVKCDEPAIKKLSQHFNAPVRFFDAATLERETPRLVNPSNVVFNEVGSHGVAEAAALAAVGPKGKLIVPKQKSSRATCAIAQAPSPIATETLGRTQGKLFVIGIGPGGKSDMTVQARKAVSEADELVGYSLYLDLLGPFAQHKTRHEFPLGAEIQRVDFALDLAAEGKQVGLICSGDPGIYAMASLVFEQLEWKPSPERKQVEIEVFPGVSAAQMAAARIGAPLGHDFCFISLSDLLTPWESIEQRLRAAALGDFVVALYNPVSRRRDWQLEKAKTIFLVNRPPETPVVIARNLGRDEEQVSIVMLSELSVSMVDMLTVVLIGASTTRKYGDRVYTPRGYSVKSEEIA